MHTPAPIELMNVCLLRDDANRMLVQDRTDPSWPVLCFPGGTSKSAKRARMPSSAKCRRKPG